ncbi:hypothetical protein [Geodermatophilus maliterrae]|uniref:Uncharacterized protein n=1 Tax=Geodermatophilus maliterrae TaxID=3162531 RepID=A0ABV3XC99_9ACTN
MTPGRQAAATASGIATALLAGPWRRREAVRRVAVALGYARAPRWVGALVAEVLLTYRDAPADRPRELAAFVRTTGGWARGEAAGVPPRVVLRQPVPTRAVRVRAPAADVPDLAALARLLDLDQGELAWFADVRSWERTADDEALRHYRWRTVPRPAGGVRLLAAPKPRLREAQRRVLRHVLAPVPVHPAAHGCVPGRSGRTAALPHARGRRRARHGPRGVLRRRTGRPGVGGAAGRRRADRAGGARADRAGDHGGARGGVAAGAGARGRRRPRPAPPARAAAGRPAPATRRADVAGAGQPGVHAAGPPAGRAGRGLGRRPHPLRRRPDLQRPTLPRPERDALRALLHNCAVHGWASQVRDRDPATFRDHVLGRVARAASVDPVLGARLRVLAARIDWAQPPP